MGVIFTKEVLILKQKKESGLRPPLKKSEKEKKSP